MTGGPGSGRPPSGMPQGFPSSAAGMQGTTIPGGLPGGMNDPGGAPLGGPERQGALQSALQSAPAGGLIEGRLASLFAVGGLICLALAAVVSVTDSPLKRAQGTTQRVAIDTVRHRMEQRAGRLAGLLEAALGGSAEGNYKQLQSDVELAAQAGPEILEIGVVDNGDLNVMTSSDRARIGQKLSGPEARVVRDAVQRGQQELFEQPQAQRVFLAVPLGRGQAGQAGSEATLYMQEATTATEDDLSKLLAVQPPRVPVWMIIGFGLLGLGTAVLLLLWGQRQKDGILGRTLEMVEQLAMGNYDVHLDPQDAPQMGVLADRLNTLADNVLELQRAQQEGSLHVNKMSAELENAQVVQQTLMPDVRRIGRGALQLCGVYRSVSRLSGDWWHYYPLDEHRTLVVLADVIGHGIGAAVVGAMAYGCAAQVHQDMQGGLRPDMLLHRLNRAIWSTTKGKYTMSCFVAVLDTQKSLLTYASGAHAFPLLFRARDTVKPFIPLVAPGAPLGSSEAAEFTASTQPFEQGDLLICYTDGLIEAANAAGDPFGDKRVRQTVQRCYNRNVEEICEILLGEVSRFVGSAELDDDQTLVVARNLPTTSGAWTNT